MNGMMDMVMGFDGMKKGIKHIPGPEVCCRRGVGHRLLAAADGSGGAAAQPRQHSMLAAVLTTWPGLPLPLCAGCSRAQQRQQAHPREAGLGAHHQAGGAGEGGRRTGRSGHARVGLGTADWETALLTDAGHARPLSYLQLARTLEGAREAHPPAFPTTLRPRPRRTACA